MIFFRSTLIIFFSLCLGLGIAILQIKWLIVLLLILLFLLGLYWFRKKNYLLFWFFLSNSFIISKHIHPSLFPGHIGGPGAFVLNLYDFFLLGLYLLWIPHGVLTHKFQVKLSVSFKFFLCLFGASLLSGFQAVSIPLWSYEVFRFLFILASIFYVENNINNKKEVIVCCFALFVGVLVSFGVAILQFMGLNLPIFSILGQHQSFHFYGINRVSGLMGSANGFAIQLGFVLPVVLSFLLLYKNGIKRFILICVFFAGAMSLLLTFSRGGWIGFLFSMFIYALLAVNSGFLPKKRVLLFTIWAIFCLVMLALPFSTALSKRVFLSDHGAASSRLTLSRIALNVIKEHPFGGVGSNNYQQIMSVYDDTKLNAEGNRITDYFKDVVHNSYLLVASQTGMFGLLFFVCFIFFSLKTGIETVYKGNTFLKAVSLGIVSGLCGALLQFIKENNSLTDPVMVNFFLLSALLTALSRVNRLTKGNGCEA